MPLNDRQKREALDIVLERMSNKGVSPEQFKASWDGLKKSEKVEILEKHFVLNKQDPSFKETATTAFVQGGTLGFAPKIAGQISEEGENAKRAIEDLQETARINDPTTYMVGKLAGYVGAGALISAGVAATPLAGALGAIGLGTGATAAGVAAIEGGIATAAENIAEDRKITEDVGMASAVAGLAPSALKVAAKGTVGLTSKVLNKLGRKLSSSLDESSREFLRTLPKNLDEATSSITTKAQEGFNKIKDVFSELTEKANLTMQEADTISGKALSEEYGKIVDGISKSIYEDMSANGKVSKETITGGIALLKETAEKAPKAVSEQFGEKLGSVMGEIGNEKPALSKILENKEFIKQAEEAASVIPKDVMDLVKNLKTDKASFSKLRQIQTNLGSKIDFDSTEIDQQVYKDVYFGIREAFVERAKDIPQGVDVDRLFKEYDGAMKAARRFSNYFTPLNPDEISAKEISKHLIGKFDAATELKPWTPETQQILKTTLSELQKQMSMKPFQDVSSIRTIIKKAVDDPTILESKPIINQFLKDRGEFLKLVENPGFPDKVKNMIKAGYNKEAREEVRKVAPKLLPVLDSAYSKLDKMKRLTSPEVRDALRSFEKSGDLPSELTTYAEDLGSLIPEYGRILRNRSLLEEFAKEGKRDLFNFNGVAGAGGIYGLINNPALTALGASMYGLVNYVRKRPLHAAKLLDKAGIATGEAALKLVKAIDLADKQISQVGRGLYQNVPTQKEKPSGQ